MMKLLPPIFTPCTYDEGKALIIPVFEKILSPLCDYYMSSELLMLSKSPCLSHLILTLIIKEVIGCGDMRTSTYVVLVVSRSELLPRRGRVVS